MTIEQEIERIRQAVVTEFDANRDVAISVEARKCAEECIAAVQRSIPLGMIDRHDLEKVSTTEELVALLAKIEARGEAFKPA